MKIISDQIIAGTHLDAQNEKTPKAILEDLIEATPPNGMIINLQHDPTKPHIGRVHNIRLEADPTEIGEFFLKADIEIADDMEFNGINGFSWSFNKLLPGQPTVPLSADIFIPHPLYNDGDFMSDIASIDEVRLGKWYKKEVKPEIIGLYISTVAIFLAPIWDKYYKETVYPIVAKHFWKLREYFVVRNVGLDYTQLVQGFNGEQIAVYFRSSQAPADIAFSEDLLDTSLAHIRALLHREHQTTNRIITKIYLVFDASTSSYIVSRIDLADGSAIYEI